MLASDNDVIKIWVAPSWCRMESGDAEQVRTRDPNRAASFQQTCPLLRLLSNPGLRTSVQRGAPYRPRGRDGLGVSRKHDGFIYIIRYFVLLVNIQGRGLGT